jgi:TatA/E family protein of Tat protein translocase
LWAIIVITLFVLLLFGGDRLAVLGKGLGEGFKAFRKTVRTPPDEPPREPPRQVIDVTAEQLPSPVDSPDPASPSGRSESKEGP